MAVDKLQEFNEKVTARVEQQVDEIVSLHQCQELPAEKHYPLLALQDRISEALSAASSVANIQVQFDYIDRKKFDGDLAIKIPSLLANGGPKVFIKEHLPWVMQTLESDSFRDVIASVVSKGMYVNIKLTDNWFLQSAQSVIDLKDNFGKVNVSPNKTYVVDYSSPNVAKALHAGHIRTTILGHILSNLYQACGSKVYRVNHINDFGGFGIIIEGYQRYARNFPESMSNAERLVEVYKIRRTLEKIGETKFSMDSLDETSSEILKRYLPEVHDEKSFQASYADFIQASDKRFANLEAGNSEEVELWEKMVEWSMADFQPFYDSLNINIDFVLGESFYFQEAEKILSDAMENGKAVIFSQEMADSEIEKLNKLLADDAITAAENESRAAALQKDVGALVVLLPDDERYVVKRSDGRSIYATRDIGAISLRKKLFSPSDIIYVVGQEQKVHFARLFKAAEVLELCDPNKLNLEHKYFGFYVDNKTKKKLSSRDMVSNVNQLLEDSYKYFYDKVEQRGDIGPEELKVIATQLSVGSVVFNDLKQDVKGTVEIDISSPEKTIEGFENSGGAYIMYTACRARSILRKYGEELPSLDSIKANLVDPVEAGMLINIQRIPLVVIAAAEQANPSLLLRHLLEISLQYNSYYGRVKVINDGVADKARLLITKAVEQSLVSALKISHIECPDRI